MDHTLTTSISSSASSAILTFHSTRTTPLTSTSTFLAPSIPPTVSVIPGGGETCSGGGIETIPDARPACAINNGGGTDNTYAFDSMYSCCQGEEVRHYGHIANTTREDGTCYLYCLAQQQTVGTLIDCLGNYGGEYQFVLCNGNDTSTGNSSVEGGGASASVSGSSSASSSKVAGASATGSKSDAATVGVQHTRVGWGTLAVLGLVGVGSVVGMFL